MQMTTALAIFLVLQCCELCFTIRVPVVWSHGDVQQNESKEDFTIESFKPQNDQQKPIPVEYFEYPAKKPQFAIDIAAFHGVQNPEKTYKAEPIKPITEKEKPQLGVHKLPNKETHVFQPYQKHLKNYIPRHVVPVSSNYKIFHPYEAEEPALKEIYKDPILHKIRNDIENSKTRLQNYETEAGKPDISKDEYLESPEQTEKKLFPQKNVPVEFEVHRPERRPIYYKVQPKPNLHHHILNKKFIHPWNQNHVKIKPIHYQPVKNHIHNLRQHQAIKYDDERNEYPQIQISENLGEPEEGYDIYERGKKKFVQLRNNFDESINKAGLENRPVNRQKLELQNEKPENDNNDEHNEEEEFIPVKNYAQVRKTETVKHLPREAALDDAETYDEILNAPRLREAVKSTKAQTVYSEEGYEDSAYDHAGEQKHASDHEGHAGYLKQQESSEGKYKTPSVSAGYDDGKQSENRDKITHGKKWQDSIKNNEEKTEQEDYSETEQEHSADAYSDNINKDSNRNKRENEKRNDKDNTKIDHDVDKREINFKVPEINLDSTFLNEKEILEIAKEKLIKEEPKKDEIKEKYPYYFKTLKSISKHSPLRYAENFNLIPKKSKGGSEFYDSRSKLECPEVDDVDPLLENLKNDEKSNDNNERDQASQEKGEKNFDIVKQQPRLRGLGDKIDCFKAKYFGENPLDNPFFKEELIADPEPVTVPNRAIYKLKPYKTLSLQESKINNIVNQTKKLEDKSETDIFVLLDKLRNDQNKLIKSSIHQNDELKESTALPLNISKINFDATRDSNVYTDILNNIKNNQGNITNDSNNNNNSNNFVTPSENDSVGNTIYNFFKNKEDVTKTPHILRRKRATQFIYEPYKIIRETQAQDTKKTAIIANLSPLIKQMQTSKVVDRVTRANKEPEKNYSNNRSYKDVGRDDRPKTSNTEETTVNSFVDVNTDQRRGEPRYELSPVNHKTEYTPVEDKKSMSLEDYKSHTTTQKSSPVITTKRTVQIRRNSRQRRPTIKPVYIMTTSAPTTTDVQDVAASNTVKTTVTTTTFTPDIKSQLSDETPESAESIESDEEYEEYDEEPEVTTTTSTTTQKPLKRRIRISTTTRKPFEKVTTQAPKLRLVTRFRNYNIEDTLPRTEKYTERPVLTLRKNDKGEIATPKYREKKKKSSKSTLVTDTKKYGDDDDDDTRREEVDALIGIQHDIDDYMPHYEKDARKKYKYSQESSSEESNEQDDDDESDEDEDDEDGSEEEEDKPEMTTPEPTKRTLVRTTDAPKPTIASRSSSLEQKPIISKKTIELHKELPVNKSSPHTSEFKQDIKEVEIIKEISTSPKQNPEKHTEVLDLFKDDNLATDVNQLGDVEVFKLDLDLENGPRHGGNYRRAPEEPSTPLLENEERIKDAVTSQSENTKNVELNDRPNTRMHGGNLKPMNDFPRSRNSGRNAKLVELRDVTQDPPRAMHGGNLRLDSKTRRGGKKFEKLTELDDNRRNPPSSKDDNYKTYSSRNGGAMHGGNYRSAKLVEDKNIDSEYDIKVKEDRVKSPRSASLLNSFAQAVPLMTTTPNYILDPSKRMYYYVEA